MATVDNVDGKTIIEGQVSREARVYLFDPPKNGKTPVDGAGALCKSPIRRADVNAKLALGFTLEPVGHEPLVPVEEEAPKVKARAKK